MTMNKISTSGGLSEREKLLLTLKTRIKEISNICYHHKQIYLIRYAISHTKCANPYKLQKETM